MTSIVTNPATTSQREAEPSSTARRIEARQLVCRHGRGSTGFELGPLDLRFEAGVCTALVGPSGSGKSTLLRAIAGLEDIVAGTLTIGETTVSSDGTERVGASQRQVGMVFQSGALWPHMTALQHIRFAAPSLGKADALGLLERVGLGGKHKRRPAQLSGGEAQRLALARALANTPDILLLDEPLHSVDVHLRDELAALIRTVARERGLTVVLVTHDRGEALAIADHLVVLHDGRIVQSGSNLEVLERPATAWTARFVRQAAILPLRRTPAGVESAFGPIDGIDDELPAESHTLAVVPGDAVVDEEGPARGTVLHSEPADAGDAFVVHVDLDGQTVRATSNAPCASGAEVGLSLRATPLILPVDDSKVSAATND